MTMSVAQADNHANELWPRSPWRRSKRGNLWRHYCGYRITIYRRGAGYGFCVTEAHAEDNGGSVFFKRTACRTEELAAAGALQLVAILLTS